MAEVMNFGRRKVIQVKYTHFISIPPVWLRDHNLKRRSEVVLILNDAGELIVKPVKEEQKNGKNHQISEAGLP